MRSGCWTPPPRISAPKRGAARLLTPSPPAASGPLIWPLSGDLDEGNPLAAAPLLGMRFYDWKQLHAWGAVLMFGLLALHLALHWKWIVTTARRVLRLGPAKVGPTLAEA